MCTDMKNISNKSKISEIIAVVWLKWQKYRKIFFASIDLLFPKNITHKMKNKNFIARGFSYANYLSRANESHNKIYAGVTYFMEYKNPAIKKILWQFKYYLKPQAIRQYTYILYDELVAEASDRITRIPFCNPLPLIHCPSSTYFKGRKSFDHMKELLLAFDVMQNKIAPFYICCTHAILPNQKFSALVQAQHTGTRTERFKWASERFLISEKFEEYLIQNLSCINTIYCIDDVVTTGASLRAVGNLVKEKFNTEVRTFCLCH